MKTTLTNGKIYIGDNVFIENGFVSFENGLICEVGEMKDYIKVSEGREIDLQGKFVYPGFVDAHCHIGMEEEIIGFRGDDVNEMTNPVTPNLSALDAINPNDKYFKEAIASGVTTVITGPGSANPIGGQLIAMKTGGSVLIDDLVIKSPIAMKMALGENPKVVYNEKKQAPMTRMATAAIIREAFNQCKAYMEKEEKTYDAKMEALIPVLKGELPAHIHAHRRDDIFTAMRIAEEFKLNYVIVHGTEAHISADIIAEKNVKIIAGPILSDRPKPELINLTPAGLGMLYKAGVEVALCTDSPVIPQQYLGICAGLCVREGMPANAAISAITEVPAKICGIDNRVGKLAKGLDADIVVFDGSAISLEGKCVATYVSGEMLYGDIQ